ncbi:ATP-binding cassette domain-containing protein [Amycolatopsis jejuensis]|uniref:ATP-binding cassette domain-containing protein n=1 Tax=Amycolatopsis jejuensis TaxID=330084 RepID=UPI000A05D5D7|nr:ATP-binding cassette domain-containing protein [Amycolatopsis jejuensis]
MPVPLMVADSLVKRFPIRNGPFSRDAITAVSDVSLYVNEGETLGVVGESGSGKSTLGRVLVGLLKADQGTVTIGGKDVRELERRERPQTVQMVFQDPYSSLNPRMTIEANIGYPLRIQGSPRREIRERVADLLVRVGLHPNHGSHYPHQLSGGQLQRVNIARALSLSPKLIVCDEAVSALDKSVQAQILNLLKDLQSELGLTYVFISHDLNVVEYMSDHVLVMYHGEVVESVAAEQLYANPQHEYSRLLLSSIPSIDPDTRTLAHPRQTG